MFFKTQICTLMQFYHSSPQIHHQRILHYTNKREDDRKLIFFSSLAFVFPIYYINTNEIPGELSRENLVSSHAKITCYLHM